MHQLQLAKMPAPVQASAGAQEQQQTPVPASTPPGEKPLLGCTSLLGLHACLFVRHTHHLSCW